MSTSTFDTELEKALKAENPFLYACKNCSKEVVITVLAIKLVDIHADHDIAFRYACANGRLDTAKWLYNISKLEGKMINIHVASEDAFQHACANGHKAVAEWLCELAVAEGNPIQIHADDELAFRYACKFGRKEIAEWLIDIAKREPNGKPINIHATIDDALRCARDNGHTDIVVWLNTMFDTKPAVVELKPDVERTNSSGKEVPKPDVERANYDADFIKAWEDCDPDSIKLIYSTAKSQNMPISINAHQTALYLACKHRRWYMAFWICNMAKASGLVLDMSVARESYTKSEFCGFMLSLDSVSK